MRRNFLYLAAAVAVSIGFVKAWRSPGPDYLQFWTIGRAMPVASYDALHKHRIAYEPGVNSTVDRAAAAGPGRLYLTGTPLYYSLCAVGAGANFETSLRVFQLASVVAFLGGLVFVLRTWGYSAERVCLITAACFLFCVPLYHDIVQANVSRLYVGLVAVLLWAVRRGSFAARTAGSQGLLAVLVLFKPFLALAFPALLLLRLVNRRWRHAAYETGGFVGGLVLGLLFPSMTIEVPLGLWADFVRIQTHYVEDGDYSNRSLGDASVVEALAGLLHVSVVQLAAGVGLFGLVAMAIAVSLVAARSRATPGDLRAEIEEAELAVLLGAAGFLVISPLVWQHYYLLTLVLALFLMSHPPGALAMRRVHAAGCGLALLLLAGFPLAPRVAVFAPGDHPVISSILDGRFAAANILACCLGALALGRRLRDAVPAPRRGAGLAHAARP